MTLRKIDFDGENLGGDFNFRPNPVLGKKGVF